MREIKKTLKSALHALGIEYGPREFHITHTAFFLLCAVLLLFGALIGRELL